MKIATHALVPCALMLALSGPIAMAERPGSPEWLFGTPNGVTPTPVRSESAVNPLTGESGPTKKTNERSPLETIEQIDMSFAHFGQVSAPLGIGTFEDVYGRIALRTPGNDPAAPTLTSAETNHRRSDLSNEALGIDFVPETPYQVRRIAAILLEDASRDQALIYRAWLGSMSEEEHLKLIETLHAPMKDVDRVVQRVAPQADATQTDAYRSALIQLRNHDYLMREETKPGSKPSLLEGLAPVATGSANRDVAAIRQVMLGARANQKPSE